jgi:hypothetical protein
VRSCLSAGQGVAQPVPKSRNGAGARRIHVKGGADSVEEPLKHLMQELGNAINDSLSESDRIAEAIGQIKQAGYDVFLVLEATIGFNKRDENGEIEEEDDDSETADIRPEPKRTFEAAKIKFTSQDQRFLRALKISLEEDPR